MYRRGWTIRLHCLLTVTQHDKQRFKISQVLHAVVKDARAKVLLAENLRKVFCGLFEPFIINQWISLAYLQARTVLYHTLSVHEDARELLYHDAGQEQTWYHGKNK